MGNARTTTRLLVAAGVGVVVLPLVSVWLLRKRRALLAAAAPSTAAVPGFASTQPGSTAAAAAPPATSPGGEVYARMASAFRERGLDTAAIAAVADWFGGLPAAAEAAASPSAALHHAGDSASSLLLSGSGAPTKAASAAAAAAAVGAGSGAPWPLRYACFSPPLPPRAVRLLVVPLNGDPPLAALAAAVSQAVLRLLPEGWIAFPNARSNLHITVCHTSYPADPRPDTLSAAAGAAAAALPPHERPGIDAAQWEAEVGAMRRVVAGVEAPTVQVERVLMAPSGTLLITWTDPQAQVAELRRRLLSAFPGACTRQPAIIHTSLLRVLTPRQLPPATVAAVADACEAWTVRLRGRPLTAAEAWFVAEEEFSTIEGERLVLPFAR